MNISQDEREQGQPVDLHLEPSEDLTSALDDARNRRNLRGPFASGKDAVCNMLEE